MHISAVEEYGLRCALQLASLSEGSLLSASHVAEREGISVQYASKLLHLMRKAGLISATRGMQGGFRLVQKPEQISLRTVFAAFREVKASHCTQFKGQQQECVHLQGCSVRPVFDVLSYYFDSVLDHLTLSDLLRTEAETKRRVEDFASIQAERLRARFHAASQSANVLGSSL